MNPRSFPTTPSVFPTTKEQRQTPVQSQPPSDFLCPLIHTLLMEPMLSEATGITYECSAIMSWKSVHGDVCPVTGCAMGNLVFNQELQARIIEWRQQQQRTKAIRRHLRRNSVNQSGSNVSKNNASVLEESEDQSKVAPQMHDRILDLVRVHTTCNLQQHASKHQEAMWKPTKTSCLKKKAAVPSSIFKKMAVTKAASRRKSGSIFRNGPTLNVPSCAPINFKTSAAVAAPQSFSTKNPTPTPTLENERPAKRSRCSYPKKSDSIFYNSPTLNLPLCPTQHSSA